MSHDSSLEPILRAVEPALRLVSERHLRRVLQFLTDRGRVLPSNPDLPYWFSRADLAAADVLAREVLSGTEPRLLLVTDPDDRLIERRPLPEQLRTYWRVLFRAAVLATIDNQIAAKSLTPDICAERINAFGPSAAREIRYVLETEHLVAEGAGAADLYRMFAAVYLDLHHFTGHAVEEFFPALPHGPQVIELLSGGVPVETIAAATRPAGAADPEREAPPDERWAEGAARGTEDAAVQPGDLPARIRAARDAEQKGNLVRAAILYTQVAGSATAGARPLATSGASGAVAKLVERLGTVLGWDEHTRREWRQALAPLLPLAAAGIWPRAARCLYELQRIPADLNREVYAVDLPEALRTFGRRAVRRELPHARPVMILMALNKAHQQLLRAGLGEHEQLRLDLLLHREREHKEHEIRDRLGPVLADAFTASGLVPKNRVEEVARDKAVAELLDRVCDRGFLRFGNLRDAVARNQMKLPDLKGPVEFAAGDPLLRADVNLAYALDGIYRRGEFYLRWINRFSSLFFGTPWGRVLTLYLLLPFGGAFLVLMSALEVQHISHKVGAIVSKSLAAKPRPAAPVLPVPSALPSAKTVPAPAAPVKKPEVDDKNSDYYEEEVPDPPASEPQGGGPAVLDRDRVDVAVNVFTSSASSTVPQEEHHGYNFVTAPNLIGLGLFFLLVIHVPPVRRAVVALVVLLWRVIRGALWDVPGAVWRSRELKALRLSSTTRFVRRHFFAPLLIALLVVGVLFIVGVPVRFLWWWGAALFATLTAAHNTPYGWLVQERVAETLADWWRQVRVNLLPGLIETLIDWFRMLANWVERQLYRVDEWVRFRSGDAQGSLALKAALGLLWFPVSYVTRFGFYLLFEPQVNPVKHFPVVTVSHKVLAPLLITMIPALSGVVGDKLAYQIWFFTQLLLPGVFGFLAWELKENWRLYAANRAVGLKPVVIGSHGESMRGLLRPGFHSGTVPKLHRQTRRASEAGNRAKVAHLHHELEHAGEGVRRFVERELLPLLAGRPEWADAPVQVGSVRFGVQRVEVELLCPTIGGPAVLAFENVGGVIEAGVPAPGWTEKLTTAQSESLTFALRGLLDLGAAARYDGRPREAANGPPSVPTGLTTRVTWAEWAARW
ncbi:hypothetical protein [Gemmata obscuriglobus]|uniref:Uncharacterized protein n=1 Tax=Gemmata obscuriglobus TaxID=114 RepID=A0A2Z3H4B0_9BACT|nr:hypothetical protein [Gemmata obscuriglobus]AWM37945.1 hypothetical protein C1280_13725 [Gemmata obscuriglobus]